MFRNYEIITANRSLKCKLTLFFNGKKNIVFNNSIRYFINQQRVLISPHNM